MNTLMALKLQKPFLSRFWAIGGCNSSLWDTTKNKARSSKRKLFLQLFGTHKHRKTEANKTIIHLWMIKRKGTPSFGSGDRCLSHFCIDNIANQNLVLVGRRIFVGCGGCLEVFHILPCRWSLVGSRWGIAGFSITFLILEFPQEPQWRCGCPP